MLRLKTFQSFSLMLLLIITLLLLPNCSKNFNPFEPAEKNNQNENQSSSGTSPYFKTMAIGYEYFKEGEQYFQKNDIPPSCPYPGDVFLDTNPEGGYSSIHMGGLINGGWDLPTSTGRGDSVVYKITLAQTLISAILDIRYANVRAWQKIDVYINDVKKGQIHFTPSNSWSTPSWTTTKVVLGWLNANQEYTIKFVMVDGGGCGVNIDKFRIAENPIIGDQFYIQEWGKQQGGYWDTQKYISGDFNGDGKMDVVRVFNDNNQASADVLISSGSSFSWSRWMTRMGGYWDTQRWVAGDFNGDGKWDIARVFNDSNGISIDVLISAGSYFHAPTGWRWLTRSGGWQDVQKFVAGDYNGDNKCDIAVLWNDSGYNSLAVFTSTGSSFNLIAGWISRNGGFGPDWSLVGGDYNGDRKSDLAIVWRDANSLVSIGFWLSTGSSFMPSQQWVTRWGTYSDGTQPGEIAQKWVAGDFNNDGKADIVKVFSENGNASIDVYLSNGGGIYACNRWATQSAGYWPTQKWYSGDFNGDGRCDVGKTFGDAGLATTHIHPSWYKFQY